MSKDNLAYDLERFEETPSEKAPKIRVKRNRAENTGSAPKLIVTALAAGILLMALIYGKVENTAIHNEIAAQAQYVNMLESENVRMQSELEEKTALKSVEVYAEEILGMQKLDKSQIEYVSISNGNIVDIPESSDNIFVRLKNSIDDFVEYLKG